MKKYLILIIFSIVLLFTGCVNVQPKIPKYSISKQDKIGYIVDVKDKVEHTHMGTTIFNNFEKTYEYKWGFSEYINDYIEKNVGENLIDLAKLGYSIENIKDLVSVKDGNWVVSKKDEYNELVNKLNLKAIVLINDEPNAIFIYPMNYETKGTGLLSHHMFGLKRYFSVLGVKSRIYILNPLAEITVEDKTLEIIYDPLMSSFEEKSGFVVPIDIENISEKEFVPVKNSNIRHLDFLLDTTLNHLSKR